MYETRKSRRSSLLLQGQNGARSKANLYFGLGLGLWMRPLDLDRRSVGACQLSGVVVDGLLYLMVVLVALRAGHTKVYAACKKKKNKTKSKNS